MGREKLEKRLPDLELENRHPALLVLVLDQLHVLVLHHVSFLVLVYLSLFRVVGYRNRRAGF